MRDTLALIWSIWPPPTAQVMTTTLLLLLLLLLLLSPPVLPQPAVGGEGHQLHSFLRPQGRVTASQPLPVTGVTDRVGLGREW